jgi:SAM-dependent methyltransferase
MADQKVRQLETELILSVAEQLIAQRGPSLDFFDAGCGNGYTLSIVNVNYPHFRAMGFEYSPDLAALARQRFNGDNPRIISSDIRQPEWNEGKFADFVIMQRVLINLLDRTHQEKALRNVLAAIRPGGILLLIEGFQSGLDNLNRARAEFGLAAIPPAHHNLMLTENILDAVADISERSPSTLAVPANFLSTHYYAARVLHPLALGNHPFARNSEFVRFMSDALRSNVGDYSPVKAVCLMRKP